MCGSSPRCGCTAARPGRAQAQRGGGGGAGHPVPMPPAPGWVPGVTAPATPCTLPATASCGLRHPHRPPRGCPAGVARPAARIRRLHDTRNRDISDHRGTLVDTGGTCCPPKPRLLTHRSPAAQQDTEPPAWSRSWCGSTKAPPALIAQLRRLRVTARPWALATLWCQVAMSHTARAACVPPPRLFREVLSGQLSHPGNGCTCPARTLPSQGVDVAPTLPSPRGGCDPSTASWGP